MRVALYHSASGYSARYLRGLLSEARKQIRPTLAPAQKQKLRARDSAMPIYVRVQARGASGHFTISRISLPPNPTVGDFAIFAYAQARWRAGINRSALYAGYEPPPDANLALKKQEVAKPAKPAPSLNRDIEKLDKSIERHRKGIRKAEGLIRRYETLIKKVEQKKRRLRRKLEQEDASKLSKREYAARRRAKREQAQAAPADR